MPGPQNLFTHADQFDDASWSRLNATVTANQTTAPDGSLSGDLFTDTNDGGTASYHSVSQSVATRPGGVLTFSVHVKDASAGATPCVFVSLDGGSTGVIFDSSTGAITSVYPPAQAVLVDYGVEPGPNGWFRVWIAQREATNLTAFSAAVYSATTVTSLYAGTATARFFLWGAQATRSLTLQSYVKTTTTAVDDGSTLRSRVLEVQNLAAHSEAWATSPWFVNTHVTSSNGTTDVTDPLGGTSATKVVYDGAGTAQQYLIAQNLRIAQINGGVSAASGRAFSIGFWIRASTSFSLQFTDNAGLTFHVITVGTTWRFYQSSDVTQAPGASWQIALYLIAGDSAAKTFYVWGAQASFGPRLGLYAKTQGALAGGGPGRALRLSASTVQNLVTHSESLANGAWSAANLTVVDNASINPLNGLVTADYVGETAATGFHSVQQSVSTNLLEGETYTLSAFLNGGTRQYAVLRASTAAAYEATFDLVNGTVTHQSNLVAAGLVVLGGGWYRAWIRFRAADVGTLSALVALSSTGGAYASYLGDASKYLYAFGVQLTRGDLSPYVPTAAAAVGPSGAIRQRGLPPQNLALYSEQLDQGAGWIVSGTGSVSANQVPNPLNGAIDADAFLDTSTNGAHGLNGAAVTASARSLSASIYVKLAKSGSVPVILVGVIGAFGGNGTYFNLVTGAKLDVLSAGQASRMESLGNGWFRLSVYGAAQAPFATSQLYVLACPSLGTNSYAGDGTAAFYAWGAEIVAGAAPVPYVKTGAQPLGADIGALGEAVVTRGERTSLQNLLLYSEQFDQSPWQQLAGVTVTANAAVAPDGTMSADRLTSASGTAYVQQNIAVAALSSAYTASVWLRSDVPVAATLVLADANDGVPWFQTAVTLTTTWQRFSVTYFPTPASSVGLAIQVQVNAASSSASLDAWGAQIAAAPTATPYVRAGASAVNPDGISMRGAA